MQRTNAIGTGTRNICINVPTDWAEEVKEAAREVQASLGKYLMNFSERGIQKKNPERAHKLREIRRQYYGDALLAVVIMLTLTSCR